MLLKDNIAKQLNQASQADFSRVLAKPWLPLLVANDPHLLTLNDYLLAHVWATYAHKFGIASNFSFSIVPTAFFNSESMSFMNEVLKTATHLQHNPVALLGELGKQLKHQKRQGTLNTRLNSWQLLNLLPAKIKTKVMRYPYKGNPILDLVYDYFLNVDLPDYWQMRENAMGERVQQFYRQVQHLDDVRFTYLYGHTPTTAENDLLNVVRRGKNLKANYLRAFGFPSYYTAYPFFDKDVARLTAQFHRIQRTGLIMRRNAYQPDEVTDIATAGELFNVIKALLSDI